MGAERRGIETFRLSTSARFLRAWVVGLVPVFVAFAIVMFQRTPESGGDDSGRWVLIPFVGVAVAQALWSILWMPTRIEIDERGIRFVARLRNTAVRWSALRSVGPPRFDLQRFTLVWRWDGGKVSTPGQWERQHVLLTSVQRHAPHVTLERL